MAPAESACRLSDLAQVAWADPRGLWLHIGGWLRPPADAPAAMMATRPDAWQYLYMVAS